MSQLKKKIRRKNDLKGNWLFGQDNIEYRGQNLKVILNSN